VTPSQQIADFLRSYPQIYLACHRRHVRDKKTRKALSLNQASILDHLDDVEPTPLHTLAKHMGVTASTMSLNVDRLERAGFLYRQRDRGDARRIELRLTETGARIKEQQNVLDPDLVAALLKRLGGPARALALCGLELLADAAAEMTAGRQTGNRGPMSSSGKRKRSLP
jgi:MarR family transcriptional regulator, organic hydroperoxide resistance regulator